MAVQNLLAHVLELQGGHTVIATLAFVGALYLSSALLGASGAVLRRWVGPCCRRVTWRKGEWAVVTGSTDGIGLAYAHELASRGLNIVLISRSFEKLKAVADEMRKAHPGVTVDTIAADFSDAGDIYTRIGKDLENKVVSVLINNVGINHPAKYFYELDAATRRSMVAVNLTSCVEMSALVLRGMRDRKRGAIVNLASAAGRVPIGNPLYALYSGTKAGVDYFSRSLHHELAGSGVHVQCQSPYFVATALSKIRHASLFVPSPSGYARAGVAAIGGGASVVPYWTHALQDAIISSLPHSLLHAILVPMHKDIRRRVLAKEARVGEGDAARVVSPRKGSKGA